ncbi:MAG: ParA family protein [Peptostreptococcaceae bacterium]
MAQNIITHMSFKGGSSKTCLNLNFTFEYLNTFKDKKVLFIDADPQSNASIFLLGEEVIESNVYTLKDGLEKNISLDKLILKSPIEHFKNFDMIPSNINMVTLELILNSKSGKEYRLLNYLTDEINEEVINEYDLIIFDLNPAISVLNTNCFICCSSIIPIINYGCYSTLTGYNLLKNTYEEIKHALRIEKDDLAKPVITKFEKLENKKIKMWLEYVDSNQTLKNSLKQTMRKSVHYENAVLYNMPISTYLEQNKVKSDIYDEMKNLIDEYIKEGIIL